ncbi:hypothetical protein TNCV_1065311 [Trichonephila clavipes]|nr:hypothetical protein TNCV_1065311 [Trichonephila clavipes]
MGICKNRTPFLRHRDILNNCETADCLLRLVEGEDRCRSLTPQGIPPQNLALTEQNSTVTSMVINDRYTYLALAMDFLGLNFTLSDKRH